MKILIVVLLFLSSLLFLNLGIIEDSSAKSLLSWKTVCWYNEQGELYYSDCISGSGVCTICPSSILEEN